MFQDFPVQQSRSLEEARIPTTEEMAARILSSLEKDEAVNTPLFSDNARKSADISALAQIMQSRATFEQSFALRFQEQSDDLRWRTERSERLANALVQAVKRMLQE